MHSEYQRSPPVFDILSVVALLCGLLTAVKVGLVGEVYASELLFPLVIILIVILKGSKKLFGQPLFIAVALSIILSLSGFIISDILANTPVDRLLRGWGRLVFLFFDGVALMLLAAHGKQNVWWFLLGLAIGQLIALLLQGVPFTYWKLGYGWPMGLLVLLLSPMLPRSLTIFLLFSLGFLNVALDSRVQGAILLVLAALVWFKGSKGQIDKSLIKYTRLLVLCGISVVLLVTGLSMTESEYSDRREDSNVGRLSGIVVGIEAILHSPFIGYGSWATSEKYSSMLQEEKAKHADPLKQAGQRATVNTGESFRQHSQLLQTWVEAGLLGASFFILYISILFKYTYWNVVSRPGDYLTPIFLYILFSALWHSFFSPFGGDTRITQIAVALMVIIVSLYERRETATNSHQAVDSSESRAGIKKPEPYSILQPKQT